MEMSDNFFESSPYGLFMDLGYFPTYTYLTVSAKKFSKLLKRFKHPIRGFIKNHRTSLFLQRLQKGHSALFLWEKAFKAKKSILDYVFTDGIAEKSIERKFVENLDISDEVAVYAKLPKGFHIPTPVGNYSPDWAIAFVQGKVKHIYFIAETKGSMSSMELREIEKNKIACAEKLFAQLSTKEVKYGKIDSYDQLINLVK